MRIKVNQEVPEYDSYAAERTRGLYNIDSNDGSHFVLDVELPIEDTSWQIGMVVGPSGSGKSSIVRELKKNTPFKEWLGDRWAKDKPIIEVLGEKDYAKATAALAAVGLGSVPSWLRPHGVLSTGEQFRANMAKLLLSDYKAVMLDEFTSVLDRQVAQVGAGAFAKSWRRKKDRRVILVTCHYDVLEWVQPDWWVNTAEAADQFAEDRGVVGTRKGKFEQAQDRKRYGGKKVGQVVV